MSLSFFSTCPSFLCPSHRIDENMLRADKLRNSPCSFLVNVQMSTSPPLDKKRRWAENFETSAEGSDAPQPSRPPLKKRFTANGSVSLNVESSAQVAGNSEIAMEEEENVFVS